MIPFSHLIQLRGPSQQLKLEVSDDSSEEELGALKRISPKKPALKAKVTKSCP